MADQDDWKSILASKLPEVFKIVLVLAGMAIVVVAATTGMQYKGSSLTVGDPVSRITLAAFGILVIALGLFLRGTSATDFKVPKAETYGITISRPGAGSPVAKVDVEGVIKKPLPDGFTLWVFRVYDDGRFYPLRQCEIDQKRNWWVARNCDAGGKPGEDRGFSVNIVGKDGAALISYVHEAAQRFKPVREELVAKTGKSNVPYLPSVLKGTQDIVPCDLVRVKSA